MWNAWEALESYVGCPGTPGLRREAPGRQKRTIWTAWEALGGTREAGKD